LRLLPDRRRRDPGDDREARRWHPGVHGYEPASAYDVLVIPTHHVATLSETKDAGLLGKLLAFARDLAREVGIAERGYRVVVNTNPDGGQTVFHLHLHLLGGRPMTWPPG